MAKLEKYGEHGGLNFYATKDGQYELNQAFIWQGKRMCKVYKLYFNGNYMGMPQSIKVANEWIKNHER